MTTSREHHSFMEMLQESVKHHVRKIVKEEAEKVRKIVEKEAEKASKEVVRRCQATADIVALEILKEYSVQDMKDHIVIKVKKQ